jgi:DNA repair protein RadC
MNMRELYIRDSFGEYYQAPTEVIIAEANRRIAIKYKRGKALNSPEVARELIRSKLVEYEYEVFACLFLDSQHRLIRFVELFRGTIDGASVYPREVVKEALQQNAAAVIFCHNHPSGYAEPSEADRSITQKLKGALNLVDIRVLDHFVVGGEEICSFAERGLL